jgi:hypothetical protein
MGVVVGMGMAAATVGPVEPGGPVGLGGLEMVVVVVAGLLDWRVVTCSLEG